MSRALPFLLAGLLVAGAVHAQDAAPRYEGWVPPLEWTPLGDGRPTVALADTAAATRPPDPWLGRDKALHAGGSLVLTLSGQYVLVSKLDVSEDDAWPYAAAAALTLGVLKEVADSRRARNPLFSWRDLAADAAGVALGLAVIWL